MTTRKLTHRIVLAELISYIEESQGESKSVLVFKITKLSEMYASILKHLGIVQPSALHSTRLKNRILASIPSLRAYQQGRDMLLAFNSNTGTAWQQVCENEKTLMQTTLQRQPLLLQRICWLPRLLLRGHFKDSVKRTEIHHLWCLW